MDNALLTLFYPFENGTLAAASGSTAFLNAQYHPAIEDWKNLHLQQHFKPYAVQLQERGLKVASEFSAPQNSQDMVLVLVPKNAVEAVYIIAQGLKMLREGGLVVCAGDNKAGGARLKKTLSQFGLADITEDSKNKARVAWAIKKNVDHAEIEKALAAGAMQPVLNGEFISMPGIFGWDKIDKGSEILARLIPDNLSGTGADFGCGYGYLSHHILKHENIRGFYCIDADFRAVKACQKNLEGGTHAPRFLWEDLTQSVSPRDLDFIVMNPPFHEGRGVDISIGVGFIKTAAQALRYGGKLWMVANTQLPYEAVLSEHFESHSKKYEGEGFKVFEAVK